MSEPNGFKFRLTPTESNALVSFEIDDFAGALVRFIVKNLQETKSLWSEIAGLQLREGAKLTVEVNGLVQDDPSSLPAMYWDSIFISSMLKSPINSAWSAEKKFAYFTNAVIKFGQLVGSILPIENQSKTLPDQDSGEHEGRQTTVTTNKYERSRANRMACIGIHGVTCGICGFNFESQYGEIGLGFIEVHHIVPVSLMGGSYRISPTTDLIPLCSNCHSMVHRKNPPFSPSELRGLMHVTTVDEKNLLT